jgi:hypothetical protein
MKIRAFEFVAVLCLATGCGKDIRPGEMFALPRERDQAIFSVSGVNITTMTNRHGTPIQGLILTDASLIRSEVDLKEPKRSRYVMFQDFLLGSLARGRYWQQQGEKRVGLGLPVVDTRSTPRRVTPPTGAIENCFRCFLTVLNHDLQGWLRKWSFDEVLRPFGAKELAAGCGKLGGRNQHGCF